MALSSASGVTFDAVAVAVLRKVTGLVALVRTVIVTLPPAPSVPTLHVTVPPLVLGFLVVERVQFPCVLVTELKCS